ncbi:MAG TPA: nucleotidyltransferase domain-containing protein [bacterium]|nr:nucleotidyltransferase domain-containing protein [bacterium]HOM26405.1 nucleotidyltransferase domain-containing protein [bacterium]
MEEKIKTFVEKTKEIFKERLKSCIIYGSYVKGNYRKGISDINLIVIVDSLSKTDLEEIKKRLSKFAYKNMIRFYLFSEWFLLSSADVFPVEWLDIKENHRVIYGEDITEKIKVEKENLRVEIERKTKQLFLDFQHSIIFERNIYSVIEDVIKNLKFLIPLIEKQMGKRIAIPEGLEIFEKNVKLKKKEIYEKVDEILKFLSEIIYLINERKEKK